MLLNNVDLSWVKLDPKNPDMGFDKKSPQYSCTVKTADKVAAEAWKKAGINVKPAEENGAVVYTAALKKKIYSDADGRSNTAPLETDPKVMFKLNLNHMNIWVKKVYQLSC